MKPHTILAGLTLTVGVGLNAYFFATTTHWSIALTFALAHIVFFAIAPRPAWVVVPCKATAELLSVTVTFLLFVSIIQSDTTTHANNQAHHDNNKSKIEQIDQRLGDIQFNSYVSIDPEYQEQQTALNKTLIDLQNRSYKYYGKTLPETFWEASAGCTSDTKKSAKITRDYAARCASIKRTLAEMTALDMEYNSEAKRQSEMSELQSRKDALVADSPKASQNNLKGLTAALGDSFDLSGVADMFLFILALAASLFIGAANIIFSLRLAEPVEFDPNNMRTPSGLRSYDKEQVLDSLIIPESVKVCTEPDGKFAAVLAESVRHHTPGAAVNKKTIQQYKSCSNDIAQAVINTLAHNQLLKKSNQSWQWLDS